MALARNPGLVRSRISRSQPARVPPRHWLAEFSASGTVLALAQLPREGPVGLDSPMLGEFLLKLVSEFFRALVLLLHAFWLSQLFWVQATLLSSAIFSLQSSILALASGIFSVSGKRQATRGSRSALASELPPLLRPILSPPSLYEDIEIPLLLAMPRFRALIFL